MNFFFLEIWLLKKRELIETLSKQDIKYNELNNKFSKEIEQINKEKEAFYIKFKLELQEKQNEIQKLQENEKKSKTWIYFWFFQENKRNFIEKSAFWIKNWI